MSFKEQTLLYLPYYFNNQLAGREVLENIYYNDYIHNNLISYLQDFNLEEKISRLSQKIVSLSSVDDKIISKSYIENITSKYNIENILINNGWAFSVR